MSHESSFFPLGTAARRAHFNADRSPLASAVTRLADALSAQRLEVAQPILGPAYELARLAEPRGVEVLFSSAALLRAESAGSTRVELEPSVLAKTLGVLGALPGEIEAIHEFLNAETGVPIGHSSGRQPLIVEGAHLYFERTFRLEGELAARLRARLAPDGRAALPELPALPGVALNVGQRHAVQRVLAQVDAGVGGLVLITGGPGTGKTFVIASLLRALARVWPAGQTPAELLARVAFAAPTGKAAHRMGESLQRALRTAENNVDRALLHALMDEARQPRTLHRLLGYRPSTGQFRHHAKNPIDAALVVVDEASMIDLAMMRQLLEATPPRAVLVLLGDADQLPSVEAGAVLRDLVEARDDRIRSCATMLTESQRQRADDPDGRSILDTAQAINQGELPGPQALAERQRLEELAFRGAEIIEADLHALLEHWFEASFALDSFVALVRRDYRIATRESGRARFYDADEACLGELFAEVGRRKLLAVTRHQIDAMNAWLHARHSRDARLFSQSESALFERRFVPGEPVLMCRNDPVRGLFNGDHGLVLRVTEPKGSRSFQAVFPSAQGFKSFPLPELRDDLEHAFAMTVHKSQGSEFECALLVLPDQPTPLLTRELIYTALTRAKRSAVIHGKRSLLLDGIRRRAERSSGLAERVTRAS